MELVENPYVSEFTKKTLEQFGWKDKDPIPADLGTMLVKLKDSLPASARTDVLIDAGRLPPDALQQIKDMLATAKKVGDTRNRQTELEAQTANMTPEVAALYQQLNAAEIIDDRAEEPAKPADEPAPPAAAAEPAATPTSSPVNEGPGPAPMVILPFCPRCGWDMRQKFDTEITDTDKQDFLASVLGGTRFSRTFELFGGALKLTFRSVLAEENKLIHRQLVLDQKAGELATSDEWVLRMLEYRLACSLERLTDKVGKVLNILPPLLEYPHTPPEDKPLQTALVPMLAYINTSVLAHEVTRRLAAQQLRHFQRVVEGLEAMALEPSFWNGIG